MEQGKPLTDQGYTGFPFPFRALASGAGWRGVLRVTPLLSIGSLVWCLKEPLIKAA